WDRAIEEFEKIPENFPNSKLSAEGVYYAGLSWQQKGDLAKAADAFQKLADKYPYSDRIKDAMKREFDIANDFASGEKVKVLGIPALSGQEKALELYKHIVKNAPFGTFGDQAQFKVGDLYKSQEEFEEAQKAYQKVVDDYPNSEWAGKARYAIADCSMQAAKKAQYDEKTAQKAIEQFQGFKQTFPEASQAIEADAAIKTLREKNALTNLQTAAFYEKQKKLSSAKVYYEEVIRQYPETSSADAARKKIEEIIKNDIEPSKSSKPWYQLW
ncbi:MAG: hypothetical protein AUJ72_05855, partial [Candidatus Omnitrophica bacterium CG1_02_46_14]